MPAPVQNLTDNLKQICDDIIKLPMPTQQQIVSIIGQFYNLTDKSPANGMVRAAMLNILSQLNSSLSKYNSKLKVATNEELLIWKTIQNAAEVINNPTDINKFNTFTKSASSLYSKLNDAVFSDIKRGFAKLFGALLFVVGVLTCGIGIGIPIAYLGNKMYESPDKAADYQKIAKNISQDDSSNQRGNFGSVRNQVNLKVAIQNLKNNPEQNQNEVGSTIKPDSVAKSLSKN